MGRETGTKRTEKEENSITLIAGIDHEGERIDAFLAAMIDDVSRSAIQRLIETEHVSVDGAVCDSKKSKITAGSNIRISFPQPQHLDINAEDIPLDIKYEDDDILIVNKQKGMVVHPGAGNYTGTLVNAIMYHCKDRLSHINGVIRPGIVHRIDKDTSGLLVIAKNDDAHRLIAKQLSEHTVTRRYLALVHDNINSDEGRIDVPIGRDKKNRLKRACFGESPKQAVTNYRVIERFGMASYVSCELETGRTHQIRVHMAHIKHPLIGDALYGPSSSRYKDMGQMLHAEKLGFYHPKDGRYIEFACNPPEDFRHLLEQLRRG